MATQPLVLPFDEQV